VFSFSMTFNSRSTNGIVKLIGCFILLAVSHVSAQEPEQEEPSLITSWPEVKQEGEVKILGIVALSPDGKLKFNSAIHTKPVRITAAIDDQVAGVEELKSDDANAFVPVILTGNYELTEAGKESDRRFAYRPAKFKSTSVQILDAEKAAEVAESSFKNAIQKSDFLRRLTPLKLENVDLYIETFQLRTSAARAGRGAPVQITNIYLTLRNFSRMNEDFEFKMPTLEITDSQGQIEVVAPSELRKKDPDSRRYNYLLKRKPEGDVLVKIKAIDEDESEKVLECPVPQPQKRGLRAVKPVQIPNA